MKKIDIEMLLNDFILYENKIKEIEKELKTYDTSNINLSYQLTIEKLQLSLKQYQVLQLEIKVKLINLGVE